jgi:hypothetical protein
MAKMAENNESNDLVDFYKQHITNLKEKRKWKIIMKKD